MIELRKNSPALRRGDLTWLKNSDESRILTFKRASGNEEILVAINMTSAPFFGSVEIAGAFEEITPNVEKNSSGLPTLSLDSFGFRIFKKK
jgi:glycosidase